MKVLSVLGQPGQKMEEKKPPEDYSRKGLTIIEVIEDKKLFGPLFRNQETWRHWKVFLKGLFGLGMDEEEAKFFSEHTGRTTAPAKQFSECFCIAGRRAGKSFISAVISSYLAIFRDWSAYLSQGEVGWIFVVSPDRQQSRVVLSYIKAIFRLDPFSDLVEKELASEIRLKNGVSVEVRTASFRSIRGYTVLAAVCDEIAFLRSEESATPDTELVTALLPALATTPGSLLLAISTPYMRAGVLWQAYKEFYAKDEADIPLIWKASTQTMNPVFKESAIRKLFQRDKVAARAEWAADFRQDLESYMPLELIEAVTIPGRTMLLPEPNVRYLAFTDPSGGVSDSFTLAIGHKDAERVIIDRVEEVRAPFDPKTVVGEFAPVLRSYRVSEVVGDKFSGRWCSSSFRENGIAYRDTDTPASDIYIEFQALVSMRKVQLLDNERVRTQLQQLERRTAPGGRDRVTHPDGFHDDCANAVAGCAIYLFRQFRIYSEAEMEARLPTAIKSERVGRIRSELAGEDYNLKKEEASMEEELRQWMGGSRIVK
jgi:hypothetical protein